MVMVAATGSSGCGLGHRVQAWTAIDGFTVITPDLHMLGFGAKLIGLGDPERISETNALTGATRSVDLKQLGGMRHQSAARYIYAHPECVLFVSSMDGRLTAFAFDRDHDQLVVTIALQYFL
jgi:hypothetical protein